MVHPFNAVVLVEGESDRIGSLSRRSLLAGAVTWQPRGSR
jgi:hypothetical protein